MGLDNAVGYPFRCDQIHLNINALAVGYPFRCDQIHLNINALGRTEDLIHDKGHEPLFRAE